MHANISLGYIYVVHARVCMSDVFFGLRCIIDLPLVWLV